MNKKIVLIMFGCIVALSVAASGSRFVTNILTSSTVTSLPPLAQAYIDQGKFYLTSHNILAARDQFKLATQNDPTNQEAQYLYGVTRIAAVVEDGQSLNTTGIDSVKEIFELAGVVFSKFNIYDSAFTTPGQLPPSTPRTGAIVDFLKAKLLPEVDGAIQNLNTVVNAGFTSTIDPTSISKISGIPLTADYADVLVTKALLKMLKCNLELLMVYGLDISLPNIQSAPNQLMTYKQFFQDASFLEAKEPARLENSRAALVDFIDVYNLASQYLLSRSGAANHLFVVDVPLTNEVISAETAGVNQFKQALAGVKASLGGPYQFQNIFTRAPGQNRFVDLSKFFDANNPISLREKLSDCSTGTAFPDPTLNGMFPLGLTGYEAGLTSLGPDLLGVTCAGHETPKIKVEPSSTYLSYTSYPQYNYYYFSGPQPVVVSNNGTSTLSVSSISLVGPDNSSFTLMTGTCGSLSPTLLPGASCTVSVDFVNPPQYQSMYAALQIVSNDISSPRTNVDVYGYSSTPGQRPVPGNFKLDLSVVGEGSIQSDFSWQFPQSMCAGTCSASYPSGTPVNLVAIASPGWVFNGWNSGCDTANGDQCALYLSSAKTVTATFIHDPKPLKVLASPSSGTYDFPPEVSLTASKYASIYYTLDGQTPNESSTKYSAPIVISPNWSTTLKFIAVDAFNVPSSVATENYIVTSGNPSLKVTTVGSGVGQVLSDTGGINCTKDSVANCEVSYSNGTPVTLTVLTGTAYTFMGWTGDCSGFAPCILTLNKDKNVSAQFGLGPNELGPKAMVGMIGFDSINNAYSGAGKNDEILVMAGDHAVGTMLMDLSKNISIIGSFNQTFTRKTTQYSILQGDLKVQSGSLRVEGLKVKP